MKMQLDDQNNCHNFFATGVISFPGQSPVTGNGIVPLLSYLSEPMEQEQSHETTNTITKDIHEWMKLLGFSDLKSFELVSDMIRANLVGRLFPAVAKLGYDSIVLYYKFAFVFFRLDDIFDAEDESDYSESLRKPKIHQEFLSELLQIWNRPAPETNTSHQPTDTTAQFEIILRSCYSLASDVDRQCSPGNIIRDPFIAQYKFSVENFFGMAKQMDDLYDNEVAYRRYRKCNSLTFPVVEFAALVCNVHVGHIVRQTKVFQEMMEACADIISFENEIFSLKKEKAQNEKLNLILIKMNQGKSPQEAFNATLRCVWDNTFHFMKLAKSLLERFPGEAQLPEFTDIMVNLVNGNPPLHLKMNRYMGLSGEKKAFKQFDSLRDQEEFAQKSICKSL